MLALAGALWLVLALLLTECPAAAATVQVPQVVRESRFDIANPAEVAEVVQQVVSFPPGAWTSPHSHGGQAVNLVMDGEITFRRGDTEQKYAAGQAWSDPTGDVHAAGNDSGAHASLLTNFLLPAGAAQTIVRGESPLQPQVTYESRHPVSSLPANAGVIQQAADFEPGASTGTIKHGGQAVHIVVFGEITYRADGQERVYRAGGAWQDPAGHAYAASNAGSDTARLFTTILLPEGIELTEPATTEGAAPAPVQPTQDTAGGLAAILPAAAAALLLLLGVGFWLARRARTAVTKGGPGEES
ncbi:MAG TPA: cupin domain-containing protein [Chloroflexia bacterium]|nr:cupin domain-containing protein [Chloroflexia bacterium]